MAWLAVPFVKSIAPPAVSEYISVSLVQRLVFWMAKKIFSERFALLFKEKINIPELPESLELLKPQSLELLKPLTPKVDFLFEEKPSLILKDYPVLHSDSGVNASLNIVHEQDHLQNHVQLAQQENVYRAEMDLKQVFEKETINDTSALITITEELLDSIQKPEWLRWLFGISKTRKWLQSLFESSSRVKTVRCSEYVLRLIGLRVENGVVSGKISDHVRVPQESLNDSNLPLGFLSNGKMMKKQIWF